MSDRIARVVGGNRATAQARFRPIASEQTAKASAKASPFKGLTIPITLGLAACLGLGFYARNQYTCEALKDSGRFFNGMSVDRCIGVLNRNPVKAFADPLAALAASY